MSRNEEKIIKEGLLLEKKTHFKQAKAVYKDILQHTTDDTILDAVRLRLGDIENLIAEKAIYQRIDENAKRVLTEIGMNIAENRVLINILLEADAIDFENETALFIPLKRSYIDHCLEQVPREMPGDPGMNTFGTGATSPFLKRNGLDELRPANRKEYEQIISLVAEQQDVVDIFSLPVGSDKTISLFDVAQLMEKSYQGLKMITTNTMAVDEVAFFKDKEDWIDGTSLITSLTPINNMVEPFLRSTHTGNNLLLIDQTIAGVSGGGSPESLLTQNHAQVIFMMIIAQTVNPGILCVHGGLPSVTGLNGNLSYSSTHQTYINAALARLNTWITGFPSAQTGGSTSEVEVTHQAVFESELSRNSLRKYGVHILRHAMGSLGDLNFFSMEKFTEDCERERYSRKIFKTCPKNFEITPLYFPADKDALKGIREIAKKGNPKNAEHTLKNVDSFRQWELLIVNAAKKNLYCPQLDDTITEAIRCEKMVT